MLERRNGIVIYSPAAFGNICPRANVWQEVTSTDGEPMNDMTEHGYSRRDFMKLAAVGGGVVFASALPGCADIRLGAAGAAGTAGAADFNFVQLSDIHWGYNNASVNPDFKGTLPKAIAAVNGLKNKPDFVVFTGDLTHTTDDPKVRRTRLKEFREMANGINVRQLLPWK